MKSYPRLLSCAALAACFPLAAQEPAPLPDLPPLPVPPTAGPSASHGARLTSMSGQFVVSGGDLAQRGSIALLLEESRASLMGLMNEVDGTSKGPKQATTPAGMIPIDVVLEGKAGDAPKNPPISYDLKFLGSQFLLGMRVDLSRGIDNDALDHAALTLLIYERALRGQKPEEVTEALVVRPWLVEGLREAKLWREGRGDWQIYQGVMKAGGGFSLDDLFEMTDERWNSMDTSSRLAFRALSGATVMALLSQTKGEEAFRNFISEVARHSGEMPVLLRRHFPDLNLSEKSLSKWVQLTLAEKGQPSLTETMNVVDTEKGFVDALQLHFRDEEGNAVVRPIEKWQEVAALKAADRLAAIRVAQESLARLSYRCFPSYRGMVLDYQQILTDLAKGETKKIDQRLAVIGEDRRIRSERAERARDYMDYFEISRARELSGQFDDYMRLKKELDQSPRQPRTDRLSKAIDIMDATYAPKPKR